ncbi:hypothetical protein [Streptomyces silvensis]|uniref:Uncharacterized protein n=1 Tax=Streptomyces silvensis TaxID=1765722 RepID=A0A0W7X3A1_9ACTN|nr:hypothetical protein [Streptomyces silvensis]KUF17366.1 hypothetical protein AT728_16320 [Streptomyces silvensis]
MSQDDEPITDAGALPLAPLDEAHLDRACTLADIAEAALGDLTQPAAGDADLVSGAQYLLDLAQTLLRQAVLVERERGDSWTAIGEAAGTSRQAAHDRWSTVAEGWALTGRRRTGIRSAPADEVAANLDAWYAQLHPDRPRAVSATLASLADPAARRAAQDRRREAARLRVEIQALKDANAAVYEASFAAIGTEQASAARAAWAGNHLDQASALDRLAAAEAPLGTEHKRAAAIQRTLAQDILNNRPAPARTERTDA